ncbi:MAG: methyltransferase domain-containing protein [Anaerolineales bacterium]|nr:methyltransferase domain-containing protein [Anaerolineales bacterium]
MQDHIRFAEGDFTSVPLPGEALDAVYSVEAVCHAVDPEKYFKEAGRLLRKGGKLILVDDYKSARSFNSSEQKWFNAYIDGWYVPGVRTIEQVVSFASKNGLQLKKNEELTPYLRLRNLPDFLASALLFPRRETSDQTCHLSVHAGEHGIAAMPAHEDRGYRMLVFEKN